MAGALMAEQLKDRFPGFRVGAGLQFLGLDDQQAAIVMVPRPEHGSTPLIFVTSSLGARKLAVGLLELADGLDAAAGDVEPEGNDG